MLCQHQDTKGSSDPPGLRQVELRSCRGAVAVAMLCDSTRWPSCQGRIRCQEEIPQAVEFRMAARSMHSPCSKGSDEKIAPLANGVGAIHKV